MKVGCNEGGRRSGHTHILGQGGRRQWYWIGGGGRESDDSFVLDMMGQYLYVCYPCVRGTRERERRRKHSGGGAIAVDVWQLGGSCDDKPT